MSKYLSEEDDPKQVNNEKFSDWMRVIKNLVNNSRIEEADVYQRAIGGINNIYKSRNTLLQDLALGSIAEVPGFLKEQFEEECQKARIMCKDSSHRDAILKAERDLKYFGGQIRSVLFYSNFENRDDLPLFEEYVKKIASLFTDKSPLYGILLRQALCSISDYRITVGNYRTLCIDDPNEGSRTPSLKRLFSNHGTTVKTLLDTIDLSKPLDIQIKQYIIDHPVSQKDWRYCFISYPQLFDLMSSSHLRMCKNTFEELIVPNKQSSGLNYSVYLYTLQILLDSKKIHVEYQSENGAYGERQLLVKNASVTFKNGNYYVKDSAGVDWTTSTPNIIDEVLAYIIAM